MQSVLTIRSSVRDDYVSMLPIKVGDDFPCCKFAGDVTLYLSDTLNCCHWLKIDCDNFGGLFVSAGSLLVSANEAVCLCCDWAKPVLTMTCC